MPRFKCWTWTLFLKNKKKEDEEYVPDDIWPEQYDKVKNKVKYLCWQIERSKEGDLHLQGYLQMYNGHECTGNSVKKIMKCNWLHYEPSRGDNNENKQYCSKRKSASPDTFVEYGHMDDCKGKRTDWEYVKDLVKQGLSAYEIIDCVPNKIPHINCIQKYVQLHRAAIGKIRPFVKNEVVVLTGSSGKGKTSKAAYHDDLTVDKDVYILEPDGDGKLWFDGYDNEKTLVIDDFYGNIKYDFFLRLIDGHRQRLSVKGGFVYKNWDKVVITSNQHPSKWYRFGTTAALHRRITQCIHYREDDTYHEYSLVIDKDLDNSVEYNGKDYDITLYTND